MTNTDNDLSDFFELIEFTLSDEFVTKWKFRFSLRFIREFQSKVIHSLSKRKPIKIAKLFEHLSSRMGYDPEQVINFFDAIDIGLYRPMIYGRLSQYQK